MDNDKTECMKHMGITPEVQAWIENNKESIDKQFNCFMEMNGYEVKEAVL